MSRQERPAAVAPFTVTTVPPAPKRVLLGDTPPSETAPQAAREPVWPLLPEASGPRSVPEFGPGPRRTSVGPTSSPQPRDNGVAAAVDAGDGESPGLWPELPDDGETWALPRSVFTDAWVRGLDDEQRCV